MFIINNVRHFFKTLSEVVLCHPYARRGQNNDNYYSITDLLNDFLVSKETVVLHRLESKTRIWLIIKRVDKG